MFAMFSYKKSCCFASCFIFRRSFSGVICCRSVNLELHRLSCNLRNSTRNYLKLLLTPPSQFLRHPKIPSEDSDGSTSIGSVSVIQFTVELSLPSFCGDQPTFEKRWLVEAFIQKWARYICIKVALHLQDMFPYFKKYAGFQSRSLLFDHRYRCRTV